MILIELNLIISRSVDGFRVIGRMSKLIPSWQRTSNRSSSHKQPAGHSWRLFVNLISTKIMLISFMICSSLLFRFYSNLIISQNYFELFFSDSSLFLFFTLCLLRFLDANGWRDETRLSRSTAENRCYIEQRNWRKRNCTGRTTSLGIPCNTGSSFMLKIFLQILFRKVVNYFFSHKLSYANILLKENISIQKPNFQQLKVKLVIFFYKKYTLYSNDCNIAAGLTQLFQWTQVELCKTTQI